MRRYSHRALVLGLLSALLVSSLLAVPSTADSHVGTLSGTVELDGEGLAGVAVFLGYGEGPRYACTDQNGDFSFANVPLATALVAATGPTIPSSTVPVTGCDNPLFLDPEATPPRPLATTYFFGGGDTITGDTHVVVSVPRVPEVGDIVTLAVEVVVLCQREGKPQAAQSSLDAYTQEVADQETAGNLTADQVDILTTHGAALQFNMGGCLGFDLVSLVEPNGRWHLRRPDGTMHTFFYGNPGDVPLFGDWDGDGLDTPGMYRPTNGFAYLTNTLPPDGGVGVAQTGLTFFFGGPGDQVFVGDWDGNGTDTLGISRNGKMFLANTNATVVADREFWFGTPTDIAFGGDPDGDGKDSVFLYRPTSGFTYFTNATPVGPNDVAPTHGTLFFGVPSDRFVIGDWNGDNIDTVGVFRPTDTTVYLRNANTTGPAGVSYGFGQTAWVPVAGIWS